MCDKTLKGGFEIVALTIAGFDPVAGAGIQADIKTFHAFNVYATSVVTTIVVQNTQGVIERIDLPHKDVEKQLEAVFSDIDIDVVKVGVLPTKETAMIVKQFIEGCDTVIFDPVLFSTSGYSLVERDALDYIRSTFLTNLFLITPNTKEAGILTDMQISSERDRRKACEMLHEKGTNNVLITGGDRNQADLLYDGTCFSEYKIEKVEKSVHGTGCTFSSAIAANLARGEDLLTAVDKAKKYMTAAISTSIAPGKGYNLIDHFYSFKREAERYHVVQMLKKAYNLLKCENIYCLIPEVQSNLVYALSYAETPNDVAGFPGRIVRAGKKIKAVECPEFGASKHIARLVLAVMDYDAAIRSAMNIKYSEAIVDTYKELDYSISFIDRKKEPEPIKREEGKSLKWEAEEAVKSTGKIPDILYDTGGIGKEPMVRVFGKTPKDVAKKVIQIHRALEHNST